MRKTLALLVLAVLPLVGSCATLQQFAALSQVDFALAGVENIELAGVDITGVRSYEDLGLADAARITAAAALGQLPLSMDLVLRGENPRSNSTSARLTQLDWTLYLRDTETIAGVMEREVLFEPGEPTDFPLGVELDLYEFFHGSARELYAVARSIAVGDPEGIHLTARPTVTTSLGPIRYPGEITIYRAE